MKISMIYVTYPDEETAKEISNVLLGEKMIACANVFPIQSSFWWENEIEADDEWASVFKTTESLAVQLLDRIDSMHPYEKPAIVSWEVKTNSNFGQWVKENTIQDA